MMKRHGLLVVPAITLLTTLGALPSAQASNRTHTDAPRDVYFYPSRTSAPVLPTEAPGRGIGDITKIRVAHTTFKVRIKLSLRELVKSGSLHEYGYAIRTGAVERQFFFTAEKGAWRGTPVRIRDARGNPLTCSGLRRSINYRANTASLLVPTACLGKPAFVRVASDMSTRQGGRVYSDAAYTRGLDTGPSGFGPKVFR